MPTLEHWLDATIRKIPFVVLVWVLSLCVSSWGACTSHSDRCGNSQRTCSDSRNSICSCGSNDLCICNSYGPVLGCASFSGILAGEVSWSCDGVIFVTSYLTCSTQVEADSIACVNAGETWANGQCQTADTEMLDSLEDACNLIDGVAHYQFNDQGNVVGYCDICQQDPAGNYSNPFVKEMYDEYASGCCEQGQAPSANSFKCNASNYGCYAADCQWTPTGDSRLQGGGIGYSQLGFNSGICNVNVSLNIDGVIAGCEDYTEQSSPSSSDSGMGSSSSGNDSTSTDQQIVDGIGAILDSLHKIIVHDSMIRKFDSSSMQGIYGIWNILDTLSFSSNDTTIVNVNVPRDTNVINVNNNTDVSGVVAAINANAVIDSINGVSLDSIKNLIRDLGVDSVRRMLENANEQDSTRNEILGEIDSVLTDTSGGPGVDTNSLLGEIDGWRDSLNAALWSYPCDTTGGRKCSNAYIGANGIANARRSMDSTWRAGADSIRNGAFGDSLNHWKNLIVNNGVLSGNGSASCPSIFTRTWSVPLGPSGLSYQFGPFGKVVCYNFFGGITFWSLARIVLRMLVAISCMLWLYHAVTGTSGGNNDEDD